MHRTMLSFRSFATYRMETRFRVQSKRHFQAMDRDVELEWNLPSEWHPSTQRLPKKGILLVHGLGDSPWSLRDQAKMLSLHGFLVRTLLLPGHGTCPEDLIDVSIDDWRSLVCEQARALDAEVDELYLGGFSTGANLVLEYAFEHPHVAGLLLLSPAIKASSSFVWLAPILSRIFPWPHTPKGHPKQNPVRYFDIPTNGLSQFYKSSIRVRRLLNKSNYAKPVVMVVAEHDSVLNTKYLLRIFQCRFTHAASRLIWYGDSSPEMQDCFRILTRKDFMPALRISQFSHMGILYSPENSLYGANGNLRLCFNGQSIEAARACEQGATVWYSDWGYRETGKIHARLTFNPYFEWQSSIVVSVLGG